MGYLDRMQLGRRVSASPMGGLPPTAYQVTLPYGLKYTATGSHVDTGVNRPWHMYIGDQTRIYLDYLDCNTEFGRCEGKGEVLQDWEDAASRCRRGWSNPGPSIGTQR